ncbi:hypothetical protein JCM3765_005773 [Sporobolomyces pararoseus]
MSTDNEGDSHILPSLTSGESTSTSKQPKVTLENLPNELLTAIVLQLDSFILPHLSSRLFPFHQAQLYRSVTLNLNQHTLFNRTLDSKDPLRPLVECLTLRFASHENSRDGHLTFPPYGTIRKLVESLTNLRSLSIDVDVPCMQFFTPTTSNFVKNRRLEELLVQSYWIYSEVEFEEWRHSQVRREERDIFDWSLLAEIQEDEIEKLGFSIGGTEQELGKVIKLERARENTYGMSYFSEEELPMETEHLERIPLSRIEFVFFRQSHSILNSLFQVLSQPRLLTHLSIFTCMEPRLRFGDSDLKIAALFPNLTHLSLGRIALPDSDSFYDSLRPLPLQYLHLGPKSRVRIQPLLDILPRKNDSKPTLSKLKNLRLDNIDIRREVPDEDGPDEDPEDRNFWTLPDWTAQCSLEKVSELKEVAKI